MIAPVKGWLVTEEPDGRILTLGIVIDKLTYELGPTIIPPVGEIIFRVTDDPRDPEVKKGLLAALNGGGEKQHG